MIFIASTVGLQVPCSMRLMLEYLLAEEPILECPDITVKMLQLILGFLLLVLFRTIGGETVHGYGAAMLTEPPASLVVEGIGDGRQHIVIADAMFSDETLRTFCGGSVLCGS